MLYVASTGPAQALLLTGDKGRVQIAGNFLELRDRQLGHVPEDAGMAPQMGVGQAHSTPHARCWAQWNRHDAPILTCTGYFAHP